MTDLTLLKQRAAPLIERLRVPWERMENADTLEEENKRLRGEIVSLKEAAYGED